MVRLELDLESELILRRNIEVKSLLRFYNLVLELEAKVLLFQITTVQ